MGLHVASLQACAVTRRWVDLFPSGLHPSYHVILGLPLGPVAALVVWLTGNMGSQARRRSDEGLCVFNICFPQKTRRRHECGLLSHEAPPC